jgi:hypothetical protein
MPSKAHTFICFGAVSGSFGFTFAASTESFIILEEMEISITQIPSNRQLIGYKDNCESAIQRVKRDTGIVNFDGCYFCCNACHKG